MANYQYPSVLPWLQRGVTARPAPSALVTNYSYGAPRLRDMPGKANHEVQQGEFLFTNDQYEIFQRFFDGVGVQVFDGFFVLGGQFIPREVRLMPDASGRLYGAPVYLKDAPLVKVKAGVLVLDASNPRALVVDTAIALGDGDIDSLDDQIISAAEDLNDSINEV